MRADRGLHLDVPSRLAAVDAACREVRALLEARGAAGPRFTLELLARECLNNAVLHGGRGASGERVSLDLRVGRTWYRLAVEDGGPGFDWRRALASVPPVDDALSGRGLALCALYAERVRFNRRGNRITLWIRKRSEEEHHA